MEKRDIQVPSRSSLPQQLLLYFNQWYMVFFAVGNIILFIWKGMNLPYPMSNFGWDVFLFVLVVLVDIARVFFGSMGNRTEELVPVIIFDILSVFSALGGMYLIRFQVYVLRMDVILNGIYIFFVASEFLFGIWMTVTLATSAV